MAKITQSDLQLLADIQTLINESERTAHMSPAEKMVLKMALPTAKPLMPEAQKRAAKTAKILTAARNRLSELPEIQIEDAGGKA